MESLFFHNETCCFKRCCVPLSSDWGQVECRSQNEMKVDERVKEGGEQAAYFKATWAFTLPVFYQNSPGSHPQEFY